jgi:integrase
MRKNALTKGELTSWMVAGIRIRKRGEAYQVDSRRRKPGGGWEGTRTCFATIAEAEAEARAKGTEKTDFGRAAFSMTHRERLDAAEAFQKMSGRASLVQAVEEWLRRHPEGKTISLARACASYLRNMKKQGRRPISIYYMKVHFLRFGKALGWKTPFPSLSEDDFTAWIARQKFSQLNARKHRQAARMLFNFMAGRKREKITQDTQPPSIWPPATVESIMRAAEKHSPDFVAPLALLFFAGIRPDEVKRMDWSSIDLEGGHVRVTASGSKVRQARAVELSSNLIKWLTRHIKGSGPLCRGESWYRDQRELVMSKTDPQIKRWPVDIARHSFAAYDYAHYQNANATAAKLGHFGGLEMFARHYKGVTTKKAAEAFFAITPSKRTKRA